MKHNFSVLLILMVFGGMALTTMNVFSQNTVIEKSASNGDFIPLMQNHELKFKEIQEAFNTYWAGREDYKGNGWKVFKRWEYVNEMRVLPDGKLQAPGYVMKEYERYLQEVNTDRSSNGNWTLIGPSAYPVNATSQPTGLGRVNAIAFHPTDANTIYIGAPSGGFWNTTDGGNSWSDLSANMPTLGVSSILIHPTDPNIIYLGSGDRDANDAPGMGVFVSTNGGVSWSQINSTMGDATVGGMVMHPTDPNIIIAATSEGVYRTTNGGALWSQSMSGNFTDVLYKPGDPAIVYSVSYSSTFGAGFYRSSDGGVSWVEITSGIMNAGTSAAGTRMVIGVSPADPSFVYLVQIQEADRTFQGLLRSTDSGLNFSIMSTTPNIFDYECNGSGTASQATYDLCIAVDPTDANTIYVGSINNWKSTDGGVNWTIVSHWVGSSYSEPCAASVHADQHCYGWNDGKLYVGHDGGVSWTGDGGTTWTEISDGLAINQIYKIGQSATDADLTIFGQQDNGTAVSDGSLITTVIGGDGTESVIDYSDADYKYGCYVRGDIRRSTGGAYSRIAFGNGIPDYGRWVTPYLLHKTNPNIMFAGYYNVWRTNNVKTASAANVSWSAISTGATYNCIEIEQSPVDLDILYVVRFNSIQRTDNANATPGSVTWTTCALPGGDTPTDLEAHPSDANIVYATAGYGVYKSTDRGVNWTNISGSLPLLYTNNIVYDKNSNEGLYVANQTSVYYRDANMADWVLFSTGLPVVDVRELEIFYHPVSNQHRLKAATYGRGLWESDLIEFGILNPANFTATSSNTQVDLSWALTAGNDVMLAFNTTPVFGTPVDGTPYTTTIPGGGTVLYTGSNTNFSHTSLTQNTDYYYKIWSYDGGTNYSTGSTFNITTTFPQPDFNVDVNFGCTGSLTVNFTDASFGAENSWAWDINNDGTVDYTTQNPSHTYSTPGLYSVKLTINNGAASIIKERMILVLNSEPTVNTGCSLVLNDNITNPYGIGIFRFALGNIDNTSSFNDGYYNNYACTQGTTLELNTSYNITIQTGTLNNEGARVFIDYNDNGTFEAGESVASFPANTVGTRTLSFTTPSSGVVLDKGLRLRVLSQYNILPANACDIGTYGQAEDYTVYFVIDAIWDGSTDTDWFTAANWNSNAVPAAVDNVVIPTGLTNYPVLTANAGCSNLSIQSGASLTVNPAIALTVNGVLTNNAGNTGLVIKSDATGTGSLIHSNANVPATVERYIAAADWGAWDDGWHFLSSPIANHPIDGVFTVFPANEYDFYAWHEPNNLWVNFKETGSPNFVDVNGSNTFSLQRGYLTAYQTTGTKAFTGNLNVANVAVSGLTLSSGTNRGWNLLGNPFVSALTWYTGWTTSNIGGVANIWNEAGRSYSPVNAGEVIPATNGFMVQVSSGTGSLTIPASARVHNTQAWYKNDSYPVIRLFAHNLGNPSFQESQVRFNPQASNNFDLEFDGNFIPGYAPEFYSLLNNQPLMVNSLPFSSEVSLPFNFIKNEGNNFRIEAMITGLSSPAVFLLDKQTGIDHNLSQSPEYNFTSNSGDSPNRFLLHFSSLGIDEPGLQSMVSAKWLDGVIQISNPQHEVITSVSIANITGQTIFNTEKYTRDSFTIDLRVSSGLYLVSIGTKSHFLVKKLFIP